MNAEEATEGDGSTTVEWEVEVQLTETNTDLVVEVEDVSEQSNTNADEASIQRVLVPEYFNLDTTNQRLVGITFNENWQRVAIDYDLTTGEQEEFYQLSDSVLINSCFDQANNVLYFLDFQSEKTYNLDSVQLDTGVVNHIYTLTYAPSTDDYLDTVHNVNLYCLPSPQHVYIKSVYVAKDTGPGQFNVHAVALTSPAEVTSVYSFASEQPNEMVMGLYEGGILTVSDGELQSTDFVSQESTTLWDEILGMPLSLVEGSNADQAYIAHFDSISDINIGESTIEQLSVEAPNDPLEFSDVKDSALDAANNRLLISDESLSSIVGIDLDTGERSIVLTDGLGEGPKMVAARYMVYSEPRSTLYIVDDGSNAAERVIAIDLQTGDRQRLGDIDNEFNVRVAGVDIDESNGYLYAASESVVYRIEIATGTTEVIASSTVGTGTLFEYLTGLDYDTANSRLLVTDSQIEAIIQIDLTTLERTIVSKDGAKGSGDGFASINGIALDAQNNLAYVTNQQNATIQTVDLLTGDRTLLTTGCESLGNGETLRGLSYSLMREALIVNEESLYEVSLGESPTCTKLPGTRFSYGVSETEDGQLFLSDNGAVYYYDYESSDKVTISK